MQEIFGEGGNPRGAEHKLTTTTKKGYPETEGKSNGQARNGRRAGPVHVLNKISQQALSPAPAALALSKVGVLVQLSGF